MSQASLFESDPSLEAQYAAVRQALTEPPRKKSNLLIATLLLFAVVQLMRSSVSSALTLIVVLTFHELGHYAGMRIFGYRDVKMFFIPMLGAAVSGKRQHVATWKEGIVLLLGPVPGIAVALALALSPYAASAWCRSLVLNLAIINGLNLLPLGFLDGGRLWQCILTSRSRVLDLVFFVVTSLLLAWLALKIHAGILAAVALGMVVMALMSVRQRWQIAGAARELQSITPGATAMLHDDSEYSRNVYLLARRALDLRQQERVPAIASTMEAIQSATRPPPTFGKSLALTVLWVSGLLAALLALVLLFANKKPKLQAQALRATGLVVMMPPKPLPFKPTDLGSHILGQEGYESLGFGRNLEVSTFRLVDGDSIRSDWVSDVLLHSVRNLRKSQFETPFSVPARASMNGWELRAVIDSKQCRVRVYLSAQYAVQLLGCSKKQEPQIGIFLDSLQAL